MKLISQADFARLHDVSRKTVTTWKKRGYIELSGSLVDVERSNAKLAASGRVSLQRVTSTADEVTGNRGMTPEVLLWETAGPNRHLASDVSGMIDPWSVAELMLRHLPQALVRPLIAEYVAMARRGANEVMTEQDIAPPPGFASWEDHPWFTKSLSEHDWAEYEAVAKEYMAQMGADA